MRLGELVFPHQLSCGVGHYTWCIRRFLVNFSLAKSQGGHASLCYLSVTLLYTTVAPCHAGTWQQDV
jgi:hypothetical protein